MRDHPRDGRGQRSANATITAASRAGDVTTVRLALESDRWPFEPVAPTTLWTDDNQRVVELHKLIRLEDDAAVFETYALAHEPPQPGGPYRMIGWWTPEQYEAATNATIEQRRATFDKPGDHEHCLLTWATIQSGDSGYHASPGGGWITVDAFEKYIRDDALRLRR
jgi:hypothetical protein